MDPFRSPALALGQSQLAVCLPFLFWPFICRGILVLLCTDIIPVLFNLELVSDAFDISLPGASLFFLIKIVNMCNTAVSKAFSCLTLVSAPFNCEGCYNDTNICLLLPCLLLFIALGFFYVPLLPLINTISKLW